MSLCFDTQSLLCLLYFIIPGLNTYYKCENCIIEYKYMFHEIIWNRPLGLLILPNKLSCSQMYGCTSRSKNHVVKFFQKLFGTVSTGMDSTHQLPNWKGNYASKMHYLRQKMSHNKLKPGIFWGLLVPQKIPIKRNMLLHASMPVNLILPAVLVRKQYVKGTCFKQTLFYLPSLIYISSRNLFTLRPPAMAPTCIGGCGLCP